MFKIFVGNLGPTCTADAIKMLFNRHVDVDDVALPVDEATGKLRGFAIVMIKDEVKARAALAAMRGARLNGRPLVINVARKKGEAPPKREPRRGFRSRPGGGSSGGGGERSGGGYGGGASSSGGSGGGGYGRPRAYGNRPSNSTRFGNRGPGPGPGGPPRDQGRGPGGPTSSR